MPLVKRILLVEDSPHDVELTMVAFEAFSKHDLESLFSIGS